MSDILVPSHQELRDLVEAFRRIPAMQRRMKVLDLAKRFAREGALVEALPRSQHTRAEASNVIALRLRQAVNAEKDCA